MAAGIAQGLEQGKREAALAVARNLLAHGVALEVIAASTGLSGEELASLREQKQQNLMKESKSHE